MFNSTNSEQLQEKWAPILEHGENITDAHKRAVTAQLLENQEQALREERAFLSEAPTVNTDPNASGAAGFSGSGDNSVAGFDPVLISLIRRSMPNLMAYDLCGVQPMNGPTGLIFAMRSRYNDQFGNEAFYNEVDSAFSAGNKQGSETQGNYSGQVGAGATVGFGTTGGQKGSNPSLLSPDPSFPAEQQAYNVGQGMRTQDSEN